MIIKIKPKLPNLIGVISVLLLIAFIYLVVKLTLFSNDAYVLVYDVAFAIAIRLAIFNSAGRIRRLTRSLLITGLSVILMAMISVLSTTDNYKSSREGGILGIMIIYGLYLGLPIVVISGALSVITFPNERTSSSA
jgi:hypothetical protein